MRVRDRHAVIHVVMLVLFAGAVLSAQEDAPGAAAGKKIGNAVRAAIDTALPGVTSLLEAIWPKKNASGNDKQSKDAVQAELVKYQKKVADDINKSLAPASSVVAQLGVVNDFSNACDKAAFSVIQLKFLLAAAPDANATKQWSSIDEEWQVASAALDSLKGATITGFDSYVTETLTRVKQAHGDTLIRIDARRKSRDAAGMSEYVSKLSGLLEATRNLTTYQITQVKAAFQAIAVPAVAPAGDKPAPPPLVEPADQKETQDFKNRVDKLLRSAGV